MNKAMRKLSTLFGGAPIPVAGLQATLMLTPKEQEILLFEQNHVKASSRYNANTQRIQMGVYRDGVFVQLRRGSFCKVVKAGFRSSVVKMLGIEVVVPNSAIQQK